MTHEKDPEVDEILAGIIDMVNGRHVVEPIDRPPVKDPRFESEQKRLFLGRYLSACMDRVREDNDPTELAPIIKQEFCDFKFNYVIGKRNYGELVAAQLISDVTLADLANEAFLKIGLLMSGQASVHDRSSVSYWRYELGIKKYRVIEKSAQIAMGLE